jgi:hypothetical protein
MTMSVDVSGLITQIMNMLFQLLPLIIVLSILPALLSALKIA